MTEDKKRKFDHVSEIIKDTIDKAKKLEDEAYNIAENAAKKAAATRYIRELLEHAAPYYETLYSDEKLVDDYGSVASSGEDAWNEINRQISQTKAIDSLNKFTVAASLTKTVESTGITLFHGTGTLLALSNVDSPTRPPFLAKTTHEGTAKRLNNYDDAMEKVYREAWVALNGVSPDKYRTALHSMRQTFDHLLHIFAPKDKVRASQYWKKKTGLLPNQVSRRERIVYAANTYIKDKSLVNGFIAKSQLILDSYKKLNELHEKGHIIPERAQRTVEEMDSVIVEFLDGFEGI